MIVIQRKNPKFFIQLKEYYNVNSRSGYFSGTINYPDYFGFFW